jgi:hypothetical protein
MKRLFTYLLALILFPQVISAVILVKKPVKTFSLSHTYIVPINVHKSKSYYAPSVWSSHHSLKQEEKQIVEHLAQQVRFNTHDANERSLCQNKPQPSAKAIPASITNSTQRNLCQVLR